MKIKNPLKKKQCQPGSRAQSGQGLTEYALILSLVALVAVGTLLIVGPDVGDVFSRITAGIAGLVEEEEDDLPDGVIEVTVSDVQSEPITGAYVYAFDGNGDYLGEYGRNQTGSAYGRSNSEGIATFQNMPDDGYQFLGYVNSNYYWSNSINFPRQDRAAIQVNAAQFTINVTDKKGKGIKNVYVYAYTANEQYWLGIYGRTDKNGVATVELPHGRYRFRAYYKRRWYVSEAFSTPDVASITINTRQEEFEVNVVDANGKGIRRVIVYAYTENNAYTGISDRTNNKGEAELKLPQGKYRLGVYYQSRWIWSAVIDPEEVESATINTGQKPFTVTVLDDEGNPAANVRVYAYTANNWYAGENGRTNNQGQVTLDLADGEYKFRADYYGAMFWSGIINTANSAAASMSVSQ